MFLLWSTVISLITLYCLKYFVRSDWLLNDFYFLVAKYSLQFASKSKQINVCILSKVVTATGLRDKFADHFT